MVIQQSSICGLARYGAFSFQIWARNVLDEDAASRYAALRELQRPRARQTSRTRGIWASRFQVHPSGALQHSRF